MRVRQLAAYVDEKVNDLRRQMPGAPEVKLLVFAALMLADESHEARGIAKAAESAVAKVSRSRGPRKRAMSRRRPWEAMRSAVTPMAGWRSCPAPGTPR